MRSRTCRSIAPTLLLALLASPARAEIAGEQVIVGEATFDKAGNITTIHAADGTIINYSQFDIWANEEMHFIQPSSDSRVLNRVLGDATHIDGGLYANGIVYIVNPAGIFFGSGAIVNVGGLYAAAGDISNADFLAHIDRFTLNGLVDNAGSIEAPAVALVGAAVANHGNIHAPDGTIALVAGDKVLLTELGSHLAVQVEGPAGSPDGPAIEQTGTVDAGTGAVSYTTGDVYSLAINHTGITRGRDIEVRASSGTVQVSGTLDASDRSAGATGGDISVTGERVALLDAKLDASGDAGGGSIRVGGDQHGSGELPNAQRTWVDEGSTLRADAVSSGDGGNVVVWSDEATGFEGTISARGGAAGGDGGFAEISSAGFLEAHGDVDLSAPSGAAGTLLYDPKDIRINGGDATANPAPDDTDGSGSTLTVGANAGQVLFGDAAALSEPFDIYESEIEGTNANIKLEATNSITSTGTFDHIQSGEAVGVVRIMDGKSLTMTAGSDGGTNAGIHLDDVSFQTVGGDIDFSTGAGDIEVANLTTTGAAGTTGGDGGKVTLSAGGTGSVNVTGAIDTSGGAGSTGAGGAGGALSVTTADGAISVASVTTTGGDGSKGGAGGNVTLTAGGTHGLVRRDAPSSQLAIVASGGAGTNGAGGDGGTVSITANGNASTSAANPNAEAISVGDVTSVGGTGAGTGGIGGKGGAVTLTASGNGAVATQAITAAGGASTSGAGGAGNQVSISTFDGSIDAASVDTRGGGGATSGGAGGNISVQAKDDNQDGASHVEVTGTLTSRGGNGANGAGGNGGNVTVRSDGKLKATTGLSGEVAQGGGFIQLLGSIDSRGGSGTTSGGRGGNVAISNTDGDPVASTDNVIVAGAITTSGGDGVSSGGQGGAINVSTVDADGNGQNDITLGALTTKGGAGTSGTGGVGGGVIVQTSRSPKIVSSTDSKDVKKEPAGGGSVTVGDVETNGGTGRFGGGNAGSVTAMVRGDTSHTLTLGAIDAIGGNASDGNGGRGGNVALLVQNHDLTIANPIRTLGGDVTNTSSSFLGGNGGTVSLTTGIEDEDTGNVVLSAAIDTTEGDSGDAATQDALGGVDVGTTANAVGITITSADSITQTGTTPFLFTTGDVSLTAKNDIGTDANKLRVHGGNERRTGSTGALLDEDTLSVTAGGTAFVLVPSDGRFLGKLSATATSPDADITITQHTAGADDEIVMAGSAGEMVLTSATSTASNVDLSVALVDPPLDPGEPSSNGTLRIADDSVHAGRVFEARSVGDVVLGSTGSTGAAITASVVQDPAATTTPVFKDAVVLIADIGADGKGGIRTEPGATIDLNGAQLAMFGSSGVGTHEQPIAITDGGRISALVSPLKDDGIPTTDNVFVADPNSAAGIFVSNAIGESATAGDLTVVTSTEFPNFLQGLKIDAGHGDIEVTNTGGKIALERSVIARPSSASAGTGGDVLLDGDVSVNADVTVRGGGDVRITGAIDDDGKTATGSLLSVVAGDVAELGGDVGSSKPLDGLRVNAQQNIQFIGSPNQTVTTGAKGITLDASGNAASVPQDATIAKTGGNLSLTSTGGAVSIADGDKLSVEGNLSLTGNTVHFTDLSALDISVQSPNTQIFARDPGLVRLASGAVVGDAGTDVIANAVSFSSAPTVVGSGPAPRIATLSGTAQNSGVIGVVPLRAAITPDLIASGGEVRDLAILVNDPGHETPEYPGVVRVPLEAQFSQDRAAAAATVTREQVLEFFACAPAGDEGVPPGCSEAPQPPYGSALDTERAVEIAHDYRELLGDSQRATAGRAALARAAEDPHAPLTSGSPAATVYLTDLARLLAQIRLLGLGDDGYRDVRADVLAKVAAEIGSPQLDAKRLGAAVETRAMGMPIQ
jgi:filamentous hemagglutinin family protein